MKNMNAAQLFDSGRTAAKSLEELWPEKAHRLQDVYVSPRKDVLACAMLFGDKKRVQVLTPKSRFPTDAAVTRFHPGEPAVAENPEHVNLVEIQTPSLEEALVFLNFPLSDHSTYAVNAATIDAVAKYSDILYFVKEELIIEPEVSLLRDAVARWRKLDPDRPLPLIYLHFPNPRSAEEESEAIFAANLHTLKSLQLQDDVPKAFKLDSLDGADKGYQAYRKNFNELVKERRETYLKPLGEAFIEEVSQLRDELAVREENLIECDELLSHVDPKAYNRLTDKFLDELDDKHKAIGQSFEDFISQQTDALKSEFVAEGHGDTLKERVLEERIRDAPKKDASLAVWDKFGLEQAVAAKSEYAALINRGTFDLEAQYCDLRIRAYDETVGDVISMTMKDELPKGIEAELLLKIENGKIRMANATIAALSKEELMSNPDKLFRYLLVIAFLAGVLGELGGPVGGGFGVFLGWKLAQKIIQAAEIKNLRSQVKLRMSTLLNALQSRGDVIRQTLITHYSRALTEELKDIRETVVNTISAYKQRTPEQTLESLELTTAAIATLDVILDSVNDDSDSDSVNDDASVNDDSVNDDSVNNDSVNNDNDSVNDDDA